MDATAMALKQSLVCSSSSYCVHSKVERISGGSVYVGRRGGPLCELLSSGFCDQGHLQYYNNNSSSNRFGGCASASVISEKEEKSCKEKKKKKTMKKKKQLKLLKGLTRDLLTLSQIGFGLDSDAALLDQVKGNIISEAAEALTEQLQKMRAQEKEAKRKLKEEKARLKHGLNCEMSSSSSSSESSDSDCGEVIDMNQLKRSNSAVAEQPLAAAAVSSNVASCEGNTKKVEVCMGGKCRKSGGGALMEEFGRAGVAAAGCKCMGKCRDGPNVKVLSEGAPSVCVGVGMEDVGMIVAKLLEENHNQLGFAAAAASAS